MAYLRRCRTCRHWLTCYTYDRHPDESAWFPCGWAGAHELDDGDRPWTYPTDGCRHHRRAWFAMAWFDLLLLRDRVRIWISNLRYGK